MRIKACKLSRNNSVIYIIRAGTAAPERKYGAVEKTTTTTNKSKMLLVVFQTIHFSFHTTLIT